MTAGFDWETDDHDWNERVQHDGEPPKQGWQRPLLRLVAAALLITTIIFVINRQVTQRAAAGAANIEADLLATHELVMRATGKEDAELLQPILSGRDSMWAFAQEKVAENGLFMNREQWGFELATPPEIESYTLSNDLSSAVISTTHVLRGTDRTGAKQEATFIQQSLYRRGEIRWLLSPPIEEETIWVRSRGLLVTVAYKQRDNEIGKQLAQELTNRAALLCLRNDIECPSDFSAEITLSDDPDALLAVAGSFPRLTRSGIPVTQRLTLPSPTLFGIPTDEQSMSLLLDTYTRVSMEAIILELVGYGCCNQLVFADAILDQILSEISVISVPSPATNLPSSIMAFDSLWGATSFDSDPQLEAALAPLTRFLVQEGQPSIQLFDNLINSEPQSYADWIDTTLSQRIDLRFADGIWQQYLLAFEAEAFIPFAPEENLVALCAETTQFGIYEIDPGHPSSARPSWRQSHTIDRHDVSMLVIDADGTVIVQGRSTLNGPESFIMLDDESVLQLGIDAFDLSGTIPQVVGAADGTGRYLPTVIYAAFGTNAVGLFRPINLTAHLIDRANCDAEQCELINTAGVPIWSADGLLTAFEIPGSSYLASLAIGNSTGSDVRNIAQGHSPFWLSNDELGYIFPTLDIVSSRIERYNHTLNSVTTLFTHSELTDALPPDLQASNEFLSIDRVFANPTDTSIQHIFLRSMRARDSYILLMAFGDELRFVGTFTARDHLLNGSYSPNGRWFSLSTNSVNGRDASNLFLHDIYRDQLKQLNAMNVAVSGQFSHGLSWSADSQWVAYSENGKLVARTADFETEYWLEQPELNCQAPYWVPSSN